MKKCAKFILESIGQAIDDCWHQSVTHFAQVPSESWARLQFWPKNWHWHSSCHYTGKLDIKFMVQTRQLRKSHPDSHYAAAIFRYQREMAVRLKAHSSFVSLDDKHRISVGEPGYPVAAVERGKRVLVPGNQEFLVADHDFTRFSLVPSITFFIDIPEEISESWYRGQVKVTLKEAALQPSSPLRHASELVASIRQEYSCVPPVLFMYTDGGPDHRITYLSVQLSLISAFLSLDLDFLCACRTAPAQSWKNPVERIMSILNLGLQSVGLMRAECTESAEQALKNCNSLKQIRAAVVQQPSLASEIANSIEPVKLLLTNVFQRLAMKWKTIKIETPTSA